MPIRKAESIISDLSYLLLPPEELSGSEWADKYFVLSEKNSGNPGKWHTRPYQRDILDSFTDRFHWRITVMKSARVGYTKLLGIDTGYHIHHDPCPSSTIQPTQGDAENYSRDEVASLIEDVPVIRELFKNAKFRDGTNNLLEKHFPGGIFTLFGANSPGGFRRITRRVVRLDEVDGYPADGAGKEGDQVALAINRTIDFWNRKVIEGSTPTIEDFSKIENSFKMSDQRRRFLPCPHCGHMQYLIWKNKDKPGGFWWEEGKPETAVYICESCDKPIQHRQKRWMDENGEWRPTAIAKDPGHIGFHIWAAYSYQSNATWEHLVRNYLDSKDNPLLYQTHINTWRGETWKDLLASAVTAEGLMARRDDYFGGQVPDGVLTLTAGIDVQDDRLEVSIWGWGRGSDSTEPGPEPEGWLIMHTVIYGAYNASATWKQLDEVINDKYKLPNGVALPIDATAVDSSDGDHSPYVYEYCNSRQSKFVYAIKGASTAGKPVIGKGSKTDFTYKDRPRKTSATVYIVGTDVVKTRIMGRLRHNLTPGPGYLHFCNDVNEEYFTQLTSEHQTVIHSRGIPKKIWVRKPGHRAETLDCTVYAYAMLHMVYRRYNKKTMWNQLERRIAVQLEPESVESDKAKGPVRSFNVLQ